MDMFNVLFSVLFLCFCSELVRKVLRVCLCYRKDVLDWCLIDLMKSCRFLMLKSQNLRSK